MVIGGVPAAAARNEGTSIRNAMASSVMTGGAIRLMSRIVSFAAY
jgi:hypothetical protein